MRSWGWLVAGGVGVWLLALFPAWLLGGEKALVQSAVALLLCLVPALATLWWALRADAAPEKQLLATLGGTGVRLLVVLGAGCLLHLSWPDVFTENLWIWIAIF